QEYKKLSFDERKSLPKKIQKDMEQFQAADYLHDTLLNAKQDKEGKILVYTSIGSVAKSGMSRRIKLYVVNDGEIIRISHLVAKIIEGNLNDNGVRIDGTGMDMGFAMVDSLEWKLNSILGTVYKLKQTWL
ncbi:MAG: hypothetical protein EB120_13100, partial [Proteobacteria bacterium]|nr:hypothetical protein [Pseudomonadota bacterium]